MKIAVTGASGHLGRLVIEALLDRGMDAADIVALVRDPDKVADSGVEVRIADYTEPSTLDAALAGIDRLLLISGSAVGQRVAQHSNVIDSAKDAGVEFVAYTSILRAADSPLLLAAEHRATEERLEASGLTYALLRNGWYWENYTSDLAGVLERGVLLGAAGSGRVAGAARADYAAAAAAVISGNVAGAVYELGGDEHLTHAEIAAVISEVGGSPVQYRNLTEAEYAGALEQAGLPAEYAHILANSDAGTAAGALDTTSAELRNLAGRPSTPFADVVRVALD